MTKNAGFTLMELLVVIGILGILAALVTPPLLSWLPNYRLQSAAQDMRSIMQATKMEAIKRNQSCSVNLDTANDTYTSPCLNRTVDLADYNAGVNFSGGTTATITFTSRGLCNVGDVFMTNRQNSRTYHLQTRPAGGISFEMM